MDAYERNRQISATPDELFAFLREPENLPKYLPPIHEAHAAGQGRVELEGDAPDGGHIHSEGYFRVRESERTMEWGAETQHTYSGRLEVRPSGDSASEVSVHLEFGPRSVEDEIQAKAGPERDAIEEALDATLESIRRQVEDGSGKVAPPAI